MADDNRIKLGLDLGGAVYALAELSSNLDDVKKSAQGVADSYEVLAGAGANYARVEKDIDASVAKAVERTNSQKAIRQALEETDEAAKKTRRSIGEFGQEIQGAGRIVQDFAQGGLGGILNNIDQVLVKFPLAAGVVTAVATAVYVALPTIKEWWREWQDGANDLPKTVSGIDDLNDRLNTNRKRLDELKGQQKVTNTELAEFNRLTAENAKLQDEANAAAIKGKQASESGAGFRRAVEEFGGGQALIDALAGNNADRRASVAEDIRKALQGDKSAMGFLRGGNRGFDEMMDRFDPAKAAAAKEAEEQRQLAIQQSVRDRQEWEQREARRKDDARKAKDKADEDQKRDQQQRQREQDALMKPFRDADAREALASMRDEDERALNGGFTGAETEQLAVSNQAGFRAQQGQATPGELQKVIAENQAMMRQLEEAGGDGSAAMSAFAQVQSQLLWALGQLRQQQQMNNAWRQMQPINGTLMDRGGG